jgi:DNA invertase Pin-like site-specific DNA recombinase
MMSSKKVIELIRVSTEGQAAADRGGIPAQRAVNRRTASQYDLEIIKTIEITDVSGTAVLRSPGMQELLQLICSPSIHGVVTKEFSRLMRPEDFCDYALLQQFIDTKTVLYLQDGPLDFDSEAGKLLGGIRALIAGQERREMLRRLQDAKESMRHAGKNPGGSTVLPYGVGYSKERGWFYTPEIEKVKRLFQIFLGGETSYEKIGRELHIPRQSVRYMMQNPLYTGLRVWDKRRDPSKQGYVSRPDGRQGYRKKIHRPEKDVIKVPVLEPIVSEAQFARVQEIIESKRLRHRRARDEAPNRYTYNGFLTCGDCGEPIYTHTSKYDFYFCKSRHPRERQRRALLGLEPCGNKYMLRRNLESKIDQVVSDFLCRRDFIERAIREHNERSQDRDSEPDNAATAAKIQGLREKRRRVMDAFFDGIISKQERDLRVEEVDQDVSAFERILLGSSDGPQSHLGLDLDAILMAVGPLAEWAFLSRDQKRRLLESMCADFTVSRYTINKLRLNVEAPARSGYKGSHPKTAA